MGREGYIREARFISLPFFFHDPASEFSQKVTSLPFQDTAYPSPFAKQAGREKKEVSSSILQCLLATGLR